MSVAPRIIVISGLPGAGKSTTSALLACRLPRAAHIEADRLQEFVTSGGVLPDASGTINPEAARQLRLRLRNACLLARSFLDSGFTAIIDDIVAARRFDDLVGDLEGVPFGFVMLLPDFAHVKARWRAMGSPFAEVWDWIDDDIRAHTPRVGLWLDTTHLTPEDTADIIFQRLDETTVNG